MNSCRRSPTSYGANLHLVGTSAAGDHTVFVACSGAVADQLWLRSQSAQEPVDWTDPKPTPTLRPGLPQIASFQLHNGSLTGQPNLHLKPDLVIVGIGGNDAGFGSLVQTCLGPGDCSTIGGTWIDHLKDVEQKISIAFQKIRAAFPTTPVLVVPYPVPIAASGCWWSAYTDNEHHFLNGFTKDLDAIQLQAAAGAHFMYLGAMTNVFADNHSQICGGPRSKVGVNLLVRNSVVGSVEQSSNILNWIHDSMHPNERGQGQMSVVMNKWLAQHPNFDAPAATADGVKVHSIQDIMANTSWKACVGTGDECRPGGVWVGTQFQNLLLELALPLLMILGGCWAWWLARIKTYRT